MSGFVLEASTVPVKRAAIDLRVGDTVRRPGDRESFVLAAVQPPIPGAAVMYLRGENGRVFVTFWSTLWLGEVAS